MDLGEHALATVASHVLCNPVVVCWLLVRGNDRARSLQCSAVLSPPGVLIAVPMFNCLPMLGVQDTVLYSHCCGGGVE